MKNVNNLRFKRTLFVGLGGAGAKTLRRLKQDIKDACGELPKQVKFLLVDTNATDLANYRDFDNNEKICIAVREPYQRYQHDISLATHEFIPKQNTPESAKESKSSKVRLGPVATIKQTSPS